MSKNKNKIGSDVNELLAEADALLNELLSSTSLNKSEYKKGDSLKKRGVMCKDEDEEKDNQDAVFYENQSPELKEGKDDQQEEEQNQQQDQDQEQEQQDQQEESQLGEQQDDQQEGQFKEDEEEIDPVQLIQSLDDDALAELYEQIKQEYMARMANKERKEDESQEEPQQQAQELKMSEKIKKVVEQKDRQIADLTKSVNELLDLVEKLASRPISKAHSGLSAVPSLQKNEKIDLRKSVMDIINNPAKLYKLSSQEASILVDYYSGQKYKNLEEMTADIVKKVL